MPELALPSLLAVIERSNRRLAELTLAEIVDPVGAGAEGGVVVGAAEVLAEALTEPAGATAGPDWATRTKA